MDERAGLLCDKFTHMKRVKEEFYGCVTKLDKRKGLILIQDCIYINKTSTRSYSL